MYVCFVQQGEWNAEKAFLDQQVCLLEQQNQEKASRLEESFTSLQTDRQMLQDRVVRSAPISNFSFFKDLFVVMLLHWETWVNGAVIDINVFIAVKREHFFLHSMLTSTFLSCVQGWSGQADERSKLHSEAADRGAGTVQGKNIYNTLVFLKCTDSYLTDFLKLRTHILCYIHFVSIVVSIFVFLNTKMNLKNTFIPTILYYSL